ncbi:MAG TPA: S41 family peptidase [Burkholderiaceae bacterium]|nr:S41 family peptidase [Burkholderiaceae bacterium]
MATKPKHAQQVRSGIPLAAARSKFYAVRPRATKGRRRSLRLSADERRELLDGLECVIDGAYAHLPLKRARYGFDPVQRLRILRTQVKDLSDAGFYTEFIDIIARMRDAHTQYTRLVLGRRDTVTLRFTIERYGPLAKPRFIATNVHQHIEGLYREFVDGVHITHWNGVPIETALKRHGEHEYGGRPDSAMDLALYSMTIRPLTNMDLPDEDSVTIGFRSTNREGEPYGPVRAAALDWHLIDSSADDGDGSDEARRARRSATLALHPLAASIKRAKHVLFAPTGAAPARPVVQRPAKGELTVEYKTYLKGGVLKAQELAGPGGPYGYLRIYHFDTEPGEFIPAVMRLLAKLPDRGLVIDVRDNPGGHIVAAEKMLQLITPGRIEPVRFSLRATPFTRALTGIGWLKDELAPWKASLEAAVRNGEQYSNALPISDPADCNSIGQVYGGPVVLVANATTYSSGDLFCAGFVDNDVGPFVCAGLGTGAGGANVWTYEDFRKTLNPTRLRLPSLPDGGSLTMSFRRATRIGRASGTPIEDVGVPAQGDPYDMTFTDLTAGNRDLLAHCVDLLRAQTFSRLQCRVNAAATRLSITAEGLDAVDVRFDGHSGKWMQLSARRPLAFSLPRGTERVEVLAYRKGRLRQRRLIRLDD